MATPDIPDAIEATGFGPAAAKKGSNNNSSCSVSSMIPDRSHFDAEDTVRYIWEGLDLPQEALNSLQLEGTGFGCPSSFKVGHLAQSSIALSALTAALIHSVRGFPSVPKVKVLLDPAVMEFKSERLYTLDGNPAPSMDRDIGGLYKTSDSYVRVHDGFPNHRNGALAVVGLPPTATRSEFAQELLSRSSLDLESAAFSQNAVIAALRSYAQWDMSPQARAISDFPIIIRKVGAEPSPGLPSRLRNLSDRCLRGLRVLELTRVIAAPVAGRTLAAHGADVLWITSPHLPSLPTLDIDTSRGKRTTQLDLRSPASRSRLESLAKDADVFIQSYRPGSLSSKGFSPSDLARLNPGIIYGSLSAYGPDGPWHANRGFDSIVQTCSGMNVSEAQHFNGGESARPLPCQALDHASGYFLAAGINAALYKRAIEGGSWEVQVSLAGTMKYLRSLGQWSQKEGFECEDAITQENLVKYLETRDTSYGELRAVKHAASVQGVMPGWDTMPKPLGSDKAEWGL